MTQRQKPGPNPWAPSESGSFVGNVGAAPVVGQRGQPYNSTNAHRVHQQSTDSDMTAGNAAASGPYHSGGWPIRSPSKKY